MSGIVAICCNQPAAFVNAHCWAMQNGFSTILPGRADWKRLKTLEVHTGRFSVITDSNTSDFIDLPTLSMEAVGNGAARSGMRLPDRPWPEPVSLLFTSGSTGRPAIVRKSEAAILSEIHRLQALLPPKFSEAELITTVPMEHMYGYAFAFWLPLWTGARLRANRVVLPQDLRSACYGASAPVWIVTTPIHLRAYCESGVAIPNVAGIFCATTSLSAALAEQARHLFGVSVTEIYGSTETGAIAFRLWREPEIVPLWRLLDGVRMRTDESARAVCDIDGIEGSIVMPDQIVLHDEGFQLTGRVSDLVKVAGKRHSLSALNGLLNALPGVSDGVFFDPSSVVAGSPEGGRLAAFVVPEPGCSHELTRRQVLDGLRALIDDVFLPRPLHVVDALPRLSTGKLRQEDLALLWADLQAKVPNGFL